MDKQIFLLIISMSIVSYIPRALPLIAFNKIEFPPILVKWLSYIPVAVLAALLTPELFVSQSELNITFEKTTLFAAASTLIVSLISRSMIWALIAGMGSYALFNALF